MAKPIIGYWKIRGLAEPYRMILTYADIDFEDVQYEQGDGPEFSREAWNSVKPTLGFEFPNLPYVIDGEYKLTESLAIYQYICEKFCPALLGDSAQNRATATMLLLIAKEIKDALTGTCYSPQFHDNIAGVIEAKLPKVQKLGDRLGNSRFLLGDNPVHADFLLFETIQMLDAISPGKSAEVSPNFETFKQNFLSLNKMAEYNERERLPWNNKFAQFK